MEFFHGARRALMASLGLIYFLSFGFNIVSITTLFAVSTLVMTLFEFPTGAIADYDSRKKSIMIALFLMSLAFFGLFIFEDFWWLAFSWILGDIAWTFSSGVSSAWSIDALNIGKKNSKIVSLISRSYLFEKGGHIIGGIIGLVVIAIKFSFIWLFVSLSQLFMLFVVWIYMEERNFNPEKAPHNYLMKSFIKAKESISYVLHRKNKQLRVLMLSDFFGIMSESAFFIAMPLFLIQIIGLNASQLSGMIALVAGLTIIGPVIAERVAKVKGVRSTLIGSVFLSSVFMIAFGLSNSFVVAVLFLTLLKIVSNVSGVIGEAAYHYEFDSKIRASLGSINNIIWAVGFSIAVFLAGIFVSLFGVVITLFISGVLALIEGIICFVGLRRD